MEAPAERARLAPLAALVVGNVALALGPWFVRLADSGPVSAGFWRVALALPHASSSVAPGLSGLVT